MSMSAPVASCMSSEHGCLVFNCLIHLWEWLDPPIPESPSSMENKKTIPATQQPLTQQHMITHHVHPELHTHGHPHLSTQLTSPQPGQLQPNGVMHQLLQSQYHSNIDARSPLLENKHEMYGTGHNHDYARRFPPNDNYNYVQSPQREQRDLPTDHNVNHELQNIPKGYNAEVYQDYMKRNPPRDTNQIYQNNQLLYRAGNQYGSKPYLPYSNRIGSQSNTELLRRQYNEIQQMKLQQQMHYQSQAQMHQQQTFAERQLLLQQIHGIQPPANLQNSIYSDGSYRDLDRYSSRTDFKEQYGGPDLQKEADRYAKNNEMKDIDKQRHYQESQWQSNQQLDYRDADRYRQMDQERNQSQSPPSDYPTPTQKHNVGVVSPMKSSDSNSPSVKSPSSDSRRSSGGTQALRSPVAQRAPSAPVALSGILYKQGSDGLKVWRKRWFVLSEYCLFYYKSQDEQKLLGSVLLPSYKVSACTAEDKVLRKYAFKLEHANMRTYILAAPEQDAMLRWVKALTMAALMQSLSEEQSLKHDRTGVRTEDCDEVPGPTYANAPPKPRRSNEGYNSPSPEMYDPNYDLLKKPASHYNQGTSHSRYQDTTYQSALNTENLYTRSPQSPPSASQPYSKRPYDTHNLSLPLTNTLTNRLENTQNSPAFRNNPQSPYFDNRTKIQQRSQEPVQEQTYERHLGSRNPFLQDTPSTEVSPKDGDLQNRNYRSAESEKINQIDKEQRLNTSANIPYNKDMYGELMARPVKPTNTTNDRLLIERRTPDAYGRSTALSGYKPKVGDYEDVYAIYAENEYGRSYSKPISPPQDAPQMSGYSENTGNYSQNHSFSGPAVLRRKKMQSGSAQPPVPRPHSADFLEYESKAELNKTMPTRSACDPPRQPQRPKSSLDINSYYDPSSDRYYSEESYAAKMRQSVQYLQQDRLGPKNIQIPLAKYASGLAEKQLNSPYLQTMNNNYETEFSRVNTENTTYGSKYADEGMNSNWTLKEKELEYQKEYLNRSGSVMSDGSNVSAYTKEAMRYEAAIPEGFMRSASARLPSTSEKEGEKKVQQREESMKRLLEWKQRMLQSPLTRKSTPAAISLARSLNQSRQSLRSDQYKTKTFPNASYNSYSSDDEEQPPGTDLQKSREMQAGRFQRESLPSTTVTQTIPPRDTPPLIATCPQLINANIRDEITEIKENAYENISTDASIKNIDEFCDKSPNVEQSSQKAIESEHGSSEDSEAESETQIEYTDNDLDEVLKSEHDTTEISQIDDDTLKRKHKSTDTNISTNIEEIKSETPPINSTEDHYLPMSPQKISLIEPAHQTILKSLSVFDQTLPYGQEDNPYVEMNLGNDEDDLQAYEIVCVNNGKVEPVYMELSSVSSSSETSKDISKSSSKIISDTASNFADTKDHTLKRKGDKSSNGGGKKSNAKRSDKFNSNKNTSRSDCSDADDEASKDMSLDTPFSRFSISDTFRPASYYLSGSRNILDVQDSSDSEILFPPPIPLSSPPCDELSDEALSKYVLEKLDKSNISQDNSILKMLTTENQKMNTVHRKTTSLMIYGSRASIHDTLCRGEKIRHSRANLSNEKYKITEQQSTFLSNSFMTHYDSNRSIETDSLMSYNADRGSSRLSLESDISSKFEMIPSNVSSEIISLNESDTAIELRHSTTYRDIEMMIKRRPLSDDSFFELQSEETNDNTQPAVKIDLDRYLNNLQTESEILRTSKPVGPLLQLPSSNSREDSTLIKDNVTRAAQLQPVSHTRSSSTPVVQSCFQHGSKGNHNMDGLYRNISDQQSGYTGSQSSCSSSGVTKSPISYYCKNFDEQKTLIKNLNKDVLSDKIKEFEGEKIVPKTGNDTNASSSTTGFHSRESSTEHSAPYYYSDLSSQEQINVLPTSHYLKNTNLHRKLNNQRRRGPLNKKNEISHIHNPIHNSQVYACDGPFELAAAARSVSVEFLSAADKDPEIDKKNIYESTSGIASKIPESMSSMSSLMSTLGYKNSNNNNENSDTNMQSPNTSRSSHASNTSAQQNAYKSSTNGETVNRTQTTEAESYENLVCQGDKLWDEDSLWRDNLRRVSHRHARSMDDQDTLPETSTSGRTSVDICGMSSLKKRKECGRKITRNVTYVNCEIQEHVLRQLDNSDVRGDNAEPQERTDDNDVYVSLAERTDALQEQADEGVYEQLTIESETSVGAQPVAGKNAYQAKGSKRFEIDREKLRQWDLMSSGLMKGAGKGAGVAQGAGAGGACSTDSGADSASNEASMTMTGANIDPNASNIIPPQALSKKSFVGSNTSIGRGVRDTIPVRAVSPRVRWVEDKSHDANYALQQMSTSQQNLNIPSAPDETWTTARSPSRASQQPIRAVSPRVRRSDIDDMQPRELTQVPAGDVPKAGELLGRTHEELVLLLIQLKRRHAATSRAMDRCNGQIAAIEDCLGSLKAGEREESIQRLDQLKFHLMELEQQYEKSKPLVQLVDNMVKLGSLYNRPGSTVERLEKNQRLRQKVLAEHAMEQSRWLESAAAGRPLETEAARARVAELWALEQELADEAALLHGLKTDKDAIQSLLTGVRGKFASTSEAPPHGLEAELARVHAMLALNSKKLEQTVADNARLERELMQLRRALHAQRHSAQQPPPAAALLEDEVSRVQQLVSALQRQRQELSRAVRQLTQQSQALQTTQHALPGSAKRRPQSSWHETNLDTGHTIEHGQTDYEYESAPLLPPGHYEMSASVNTPLYVDTQASASELVSPLTSEDMQTGALANLSNVEKQEIKTVRIVKRESERRQRDRDRSLQPMSEWSTNSSSNLEQYLEEELAQPQNYRSTSVPRTDFSKFEEYYSKPTEPTTHRSTKETQISPKFPSSPSLSNYDFTRDISSLSNSYSTYDRSYDRTLSVSTQYLNSPTDSSRTLTMDPLSKTSSIGSLTRSHMELSPIFKSEAAKQIITEMSADGKNGSLHRRLVPKEKRRHYTAPHHLSAKTLNEIPNDVYNQDKMGRSLDDADMERALRAPPDVVRSAIVPHRYAENTIDQLLAAPQKILIPERYIPEKPPELSPEEQQKRQEKVESIKKMLSGSTADPTKSPDGAERQRREHLLQMNQILAKQVMEMSKIVAAKALEELPEQDRNGDIDDRSPEVELPIYQQRDNFFS